MAALKRDDPWSNFKTAGERDTRREGRFTNLFLYLFCGAGGAVLGYLLIFSLISRRFIYFSDERLATFAYRLPLWGAGVGAILAIGFVARSLRAKAKADRR